VLANERDEGDEAPLQDGTHRKSSQGPAGIEPEIDCGFSVLLAGQCGHCLKVASESPGLLPCDCLDQLACLRSVAQPVLGRGPGIENLQENHAQCIRDNMRLPRVLAIKAKAHDQEAKFILWKLGKSLGKANLEGISGIPVMAAINLRRNLVSSASFQFSEEVPDAQDHVHPPAPKPGPAWSNDEMADDRKARQVVPAMAVQS
jgi:hypothetical protein